MADTSVDRWDELAGRLVAIEGRLEALERAVGWWVETTRGGRGAAARTDAPPPVPPVAALVEAPVVVEQSSAEAPPVVVGPGRQPTPVKAAKRVDLEAMIGRNWTSWVGAIVLVIGAIFFVQFAWEQGWLNPSPAARVMSAIAAGVGLGVAGAWVNRRAMRVLAGTLTGAGIAIVMAACFAAHVAFAPPVWSSQVALAGVCAAAGVGIWRGVRINAVSVAIIALLGAYLAPAILRSGRDQSATLMTYLGALAVVGWALAYLRPRWGAVRWFTLALTVLWMLAWIARYPVRGEHRPLAMGAITFFLAGFIAEAYFSVQRAFRARGVEGEGATPGFTAHVEDALGTVSLLATAAAFGGYYAVLRRAGGGGGGMLHLDPAAAIALGLAAVHGMISLATSSRVFARASVLAAAALVTVAVPLAFGRVAITLAWMVLAVALAALGWRRENRAVRAWCVVLLALAIGRLFTFDLSDGSLRAQRWWAGGQGVSVWLLLACGMGVFAHVVGWLFVPARDASGARVMSKWARVIPVAGTVVVFVASAMSWSGAALTGLGVVWVAGLVAVSRWGDVPGYSEHAVGALAVVATKWVIVDGMLPLVEGWSQADGRMPVVNGVAMAGVALIVLVGLLWRWEARSRERREIAGVAIGILVFAWLNFETVRWVDYGSARFVDFVTAKQVALSVLWAIVGLVSVVVGFARELRPLRYAALGLLGVTLGKILFVDLAQVRPVYRILSFVAVGALLLCVSFVYHRHEAEEQQGAGRAEE
jgi:uncharacterized membrane protein